MYAQGKFTITVRDKDTLEEIRVIERENIVTEFAEWRMHRNNGMLSGNDGASGAQYDDINLSNDKIVPGVDVAQCINHSYLSGTNLQSPTWFAPTETTPGYVELYQRFQPATSERVINSIYISQGKHYRAFAYAGLVEPCVQGTTEVLDVYYRIQFFKGQVDTDHVKYTTSTYYDDLIWEMQARGGGDWNGTPIHGTPFYGKPPADKEYYTLAQQRNVGQYTHSNRNITSRAFDDTNWMHQESYSLGTTSNTGFMMGMLSYGYAGDSSTGYRSTLFTPAVPEDFAYKPIQPIHRHTWNSPTPFLNVDYLASSTGILNVNGDNWENMNVGFPEFERIDYKSTGTVGEATYSVSDRNVINFMGDSFNTRPSVFPYMSNRYNTIPDGHGGTDIHGFVEFNDTSFILSDETGITIMDASTGRLEHHDANSTPALPVTMLYQVASENQIIYVACADTGLYKIENAFNDAVTTVITHLHTTTGCYGVDVGYNDDVFAMVEGGLIHSQDGGATFVTYDAASTPAFDMSGLIEAPRTDNWTNCRSIHIDRTSTVNQMIVKYLDPTYIGNQRARTAWWNMNGEVAQGPTFDWTLHANEGRSRLARLRCSRWGSYWVGCNNLPYKIYPGTATAHTIGTTSDYQRSHNATFMYDNYGNPYFLGFYTWVNNRMMPALYDIDRNYRGTIGWGDDWQDYYSYYAGNTDGNRLGHIFAWEKNFGNGLHMIYKGYYSNQYFNSDAFRIASVVPYDYNGLAPTWDNWNGKGTICEDMVWNKYGWNGTAWVNGYNMPATDLTANGNDGIRHNFHPGEAEFFGNAVIETPALAPMSNFTVAGTINKHASVPYMSGRYKDGLWVFEDSTTGEQIHQRIVDGTLRTGSGNVNAEAREIITEFADPEVASRLVTTVETSSNIAKEWTANGVEIKNWGTINEYRPDTDELVFYYDDDYSHTAGSQTNLFGLAPLSEVDFRISFKRTSSQNYSGNTTEQTPYSSHGRFVMYLYDATNGTPGRLTDSHENSMPDFTGEHVAIGMPKQPGHRPMLITNWTNREYNGGGEAKYFTTVEHFTAADFNGTNTISWDWIHDGTTYTINVYSNDGTNGDVLKYTAIADIRAIPRLAQPVLGWNHSAGWTAANVTETLTNFRITGTDGNPLVLPSGKAIKSYIDGNLISTYVSASTGNFDRITVGALRSRTSNAFDKPFDDFWRGKVSNIQVWNVALSQASITDDLAVAPVATATQAAGNLVAHYANTDEAYTSEVKVTHTTDEPLIKGITNSFSAGATEPSFSKSDFFNYGVIDGILKDNAISISSEYKWYTKRVQEYTQLEDPIDPTNASPVIPATVGGTITDRVTWVNPQGVTARPGRISGYHGGHGAQTYDSRRNQYGSWSYRHAWSFNYVPADTDATYEFTASMTRASLMSGFDERADTLAQTDYGNGYNYLNYAFYLKSDNTFTIYELGTHITAVGDLALAYTAGDVFKIVRTSNVVHYYHNNVLVYTSLTASAGVLWSSFCASQDVGSCIHDCKFTYLRPANIVYLGDSETKQGRWNDDFLLMETMPEAYTVTIDGVEQLVTLEWDTRLSTMADPLVGEVIIHRKAGVIKVHPNEASKAISVSYRCIQRK